MIAMMKDWIFSGDDWTCGVRVAGVLMRNGKILLQRERDGNEYALPGGHIHIGERLEEGLIREWQEEMGTEILLKRMLWTEECFWEWKGRMAHNLSFYFLIELTDDAVLPDDGLLHSHKDNSQIVLEWMTPEEMKKTVIYPDFIKNEMDCLDGPMKHFVTYA